jgi:hypothetical protein
MSFDPNAITISQIKSAYQALILLGMPSEIVSDILDLAQYWCKQSYSREESVDMGLVGRDFPETSCLYLQTEPLGFGDGFNDIFRVRPQRVVFRISSSDNSLYLSYRDYYNNLSWFSASIFRVDECWTHKRRWDPMTMIQRKSPTWRTEDGDVYWNHQRIGVNDLPVYCGEDPDTLPEWLCRDAPDKLRGGFKLVKNGERLMWVLQLNRRAEGVSEYTIEWSGEVRDEDPREKRVGIDDDCHSANDDQDSFDYDSHEDQYSDNAHNSDDDHDSYSIDSESESGEAPPGKGAGSGNNFIASLRRGDMIGIWAHTMVSILTPCHLLSYEFF